MMVKLAGEETCRETKIQKWASILLWLAHIDTVHMPAVKLACVGIT